METTTGLHDSVLEASLPIPDFVFDNSITLDSADGVFYANPQRRMPLVDALV